MPIKTPLSGYPYSDDFDASKKYYQMLFVPGTSVQVRELNQMQTYIKRQIEIFGDSIFKRGTIVDGCNFIFYNDYPYAKLVDTETNGTPVVPSLYVGMFARNAANLQAYIINYADGFEASSPDLKTIYLNYINSGNTNNLTAFSGGDILTIFDSNNGIFSVTVNNGGTAFSNSDILTIVPSVLVEMSLGTFVAGDYIVQPSTGANLEIVSVNDTLFDDPNLLVLTVKPRTTDLANSQANSLSWTLDSGEAVQNPDASKAASIVSVYGQSAAGRIVTNGVGKITTVSITDRGEGYTVLPYVTVRSVNNATGITALSLSPQNYLAQVKVSSEPESVGKGYAFSISSGHIYQKGHFLEVDSQTVIVEKYSQTPNNVVVGFDTEEEIIDSNIDSSLLDNTLGFENENAPGAHRLKLTPFLVVQDSESARANLEFFDLVEWNNGNPYKQNRVTSYSRIGDEMARRTSDESGNYVLDPFFVTTDSIANSQVEGSYYTVVVDPGSAYVSGYNVETLRNYRIDVLKGLDTKTSNNTISLNYGNYIRVNEVGGLFQYSTGDTVKFYSAPKGFISNTSLITTNNTTPQGTLMGTARMRSMILESGTPGVNTAVYRIYLFDIKMNSGKNFSDVRSLYYDGLSNKGIADVVLEPNPSTSTDVATLHDTNQDKLLFYSGVESLKNSNNSYYTYRTIDQTVVIANSGTLTKSIAASPNEFYPYTGNLSSSQMKDLYVVPTGGDLIQYTQLAGNVSVTSACNKITGVSGANFYDNFVVGDYIYVYSTLSDKEIKRITNISNSTTMTVDSTFSFTNATAIHKRVFPRNAPVPFGSRTGLYANVDINENILTLTFAHANGTTITFEGSSSTNAALGVNIERRGVTSTAKTANRSKYVKFRLANVEGNTVGPWCVGVPDIFRLRKVYIADTVDVNVNSVDVTTDFYIDHNQNQNYLDHGWLYKHPRSGLSLSSSDYLLIEFDYYSGGGNGYYDAVSYRGTANAEQISNTDSSLLANLTTAASSWEVPEIYTAKGGYIDLLNQFDFRPVVANTVAPSATDATAPLNPENTISFGNTADPSNDKKFPLPDSTMKSSVEQYLGRLDTVYIGKDGNIFVQRGIPHQDQRRRFEANHPEDALKLQTLNVPPYPNITVSISPEVRDIIQTRVANEKFVLNRLNKHTITGVNSTLENELNQPVRYTMEDIGQLERRIKDLEYYVSLSAIETSLSNKVIPSSIDGTLNRFKYGFFADDFSTGIHSDIENPQYAASIEVAGQYAYGNFKNPLQIDNWSKSDSIDPQESGLEPVTLTQRKTNRLVPPKLTWSLKHQIENMEYIDHMIVDQIYATDTTPVDNCVPTSQTVTTTTLINSYFYTMQANARSHTEVKTDYLTMGTISGGVTMWWNNYTGETLYRIYQGNTLVASTNKSANMVVSLTSTDKTWLRTNTHALPWYQLQTQYGNDLDRSWYRGTNKVITQHGVTYNEQDFIIGPAKLQFTHNPANGREYCIVAVKCECATVWKYIIEYPLSSNTTTSVIVNPCNTTSTPAPTYVGTVITNNRTIECRGMKPMTKCRVYRNGKDETGNCYGHTVRIVQGPYSNGSVSNGYTSYTPNRGDDLLTDQFGRCRTRYNPPKVRKNKTWKGHGWTLGSATTAQKRTVQRDSWEVRSSGTRAYSLETLWPPRDYNNYDNDTSYFNQNDGGGS